MFIHLFLLRADFLEDPVKVDSFYVKELPDHFVNGTKEAVNAFKIASQFQPDLYSEIGRIYTAMSLRCRYNNNNFLSSNVLLIKSPEELSPEEIELYVNSFSKADLKQFLKEAKM
jgi:energy-coupling factor transporter transmembrane protein EcfT